MQGRLAALVGIWACATGVAMAADGDRTHYSAVGMASWYGGEFHGRRTADGEVFDKGSLSAAHPNLPLPCYARVTNLHNGRSMLVRINDRGPYAAHRILDVSERVASLLDFRRFGAAKVKVEYIGMAAPAGSDEKALLASVKTGKDSAAALAALRPSLAPDTATTALAYGPPAPPLVQQAAFTANDGVTAIQRAVAHDSAPPAPSPYGTLSAYAFSPETN